MKYIGSVLINVEIFRIFYFASMNFFCSFVDVIVVYIKIIFLLFAVFEISEYFDYICFESDFYLLSFLVVIIHLSIIIAIKVNYNAVLIKV